MSEPLPFKPGDWVASRGDHDRIARVRSVYRLDGEVCLDLVMYSPKGDRIGRESPALGGPRTFEPCCASDHWDRISDPRFPIPMMWVPDGDGRKVLRRVAGKVLPPAEYVPKPRKSSYRAKSDDGLRRALEAIADGHNDPRRLAEETLGRRQPGARPGDGW